MQWQSSKEQSRWGEIQIRVNYRGVKSFKKDRNCPNRAGETTQKDRILNQMRLNHAARLIRQSHHLKERKIKK